MLFQDGVARLSRNIVLVASLLIGAGCESSNAWIPVSDPDLKRTNPQFAADAAKRSYPATAPRGGEAPVMADVDHGFRNRIQLENLSDEDWENMELWVNEKYVVFLAHWPAKSLKKVNFAMLFDRDGKPFPTSVKEAKVDKIELFRSGKIYTVAKKLAD